MDVVLLSADGEPIGRAPRAEVHSTDTPLHLAFSCHVLDPKGRVLMTRRALTKRTWPGVWTNSFCGHPQPGEPIEEALARHGRAELGLEVAAPRVELPEFRYRAKDPSGVVENEVCPVYTALADALPEPNPDEVMDMQWVEPARVAAAVRAAPWAFSPWLVLQVEALELYRSEAV